MTLQATLLAFVSLIKLTSAPILVLKYCLRRLSAAASDVLLVDCLPMTLMPAGDAVGMFVVVRAVQQSAGCNPSKFA